VVSGMAVDLILDKALPGPTPDMSKEAAGALEVGYDLFKEGMGQKVTLTERIVEYKKSN
jgi:hypothetical protein